MGGMSAREIIDLTFFEDKWDVQVTVHSKIYVEMLDEFMVPELRNVHGCYQRTWFQQDEATSRTSNKSLRRVRENLSLG